jgi:hypothetical protein
LREDPGEKKNWAADYPIKVEELSKLAAVYQADLYMTKKN